MPSAHGTSAMARRLARAMPSASSASASARGISRPMSARQRLVVARPRAAVSGSCARAFSADSSVQSCARDELVGAPLQHGEQMKAVVRQLGVAAGFGLA